MGVQSLLGRCLFALIFLSSALNKVRVWPRSAARESEALHAESHGDHDSPQAKTFGSDGGPTAVYAAPKLDAFKAQVASITGVSLDALPIEVSCLCNRRGLPRLGLRGDAWPPPLADTPRRTSTTSPSRARWRAWVPPFSFWGTSLGRRCWCDFAPRSFILRRCLDAVAPRSCCSCLQSLPSCMVSPGTLGNRHLPSHKLEAV